MDTISFMAFLEVIQAHQILSAIALVVLIAYGYHILLINAAPSEPPLIKGYVPFLGAAPQAILYPSKFLNANRSRYGDIFTVYALGLRITFVSDPIEGVPAVFKKSKQLSFKAGLQKFYTKVLGFTDERAEEDEMNKEHFQMIPTYLLASSAVDELTGRFVRFLLADIRRRSTEFKTGKTIDLFEWSGERLFFSSAPALYGEGIFDGADSILNDFKKFDEDFAARLMLPLWMTRGFAVARGRIQGVLASKFAQGLTDPSEFVKRRIEVCIPFLEVIDNRFN
jgi:25/26-hydroxycholesterol 7alpha-hydroxylase